MEKAKREKLQHELEEREAREAHVKKVLDAKKKERDDYDESKKYLPSIAQLQHNPQNVEQ